MNKQELIKMLEDIEWEDFEAKEAKSAVPKNSWETVSAFSNTAGGWLVFGVKKSGKKYFITGIDNIEKIEQDFLTTLRGEKFNKKILVGSKKNKIEGNDVLAFYIPSASSKDKPVYFNSRKNTFIRTGSGDQRATSEEIDAMYRDSSYDQKDKEITKFILKDLDVETIESYRNYLKNTAPENRYNKFSTEELLSKLGALKDGKVTIGGLLVFGKEESIANVITDFRIDYLEIMGTSYSDAEERYSYRLSEEKNLFDYYFSIMERLLKKIDIPFKLKGDFRDENPPQRIAIREALVNLLMHSDYFSPAKPRIRSFTDRLEFFNPGSLPKSIDQIIQEDFSLPRNPTI
ncbi:putative DNA binding domain-containing protein, partial [Candidatus Calescamantes bacterium]|nr:putative DNA binding domain-containing protein [Candidatus Calescamantes bacterium]